METFSVTMIFLYGNTPASRATRTCKVSAENDILARSAAVKHWFGKTAHFWSDGTGGGRGQVMRRLRGAEAMSTSVTGLVRFDVEAT